MNKKLDKISWVLLTWVSLIGWGAIAFGYWEPTTHQLALLIMPLAAFIARARYLLIEKEYGENQ